MAAAACPRSSTTRSATSAAGAVGRQQGGRPPVPQRKILRIIWFVLANDRRREDVPAGMGMLGPLCATSPEGLGLWARLRADLLGALERVGSLDPAMVLGGRRPGLRPQPRRAN